MKKAFTLVEVLIVITIIGVIAAMVMPTLINSYQEQVAVARVKEAYLIFSQAFTRAETAKGPMKYWDISTSEKLYNYLKPYLLKVQECNTSNSGKCFADEYTALFSNSNYAYKPIGNSGYSTLGVLPNGTAFSVKKIANKQEASLRIDVNGKKGPNKAGVDYFYFKIAPQGIVTVFNDGDEFCKYNDPSNKNGAFCSDWIIKNGNMDYRHRDVEAKEETDEDLIKDTEGELIQTIDNNVINKDCGLDNKSCD